MSKSRGVNDLWDIHAPVVTAVGFQQEGFSVGDLQELDHIRTEGIPAHAEQALADRFERSGAADPEFALSQHDARGPEPWTVGTVVTGESLIVRRRSKRLWAGIVRIHIPVRSVRQFRHLAIAAAEDQREATPGVFVG